MADFIKSSFLDDFELPEITHDTIKKELVKLGKTHQVQKKNSLDGMPLTDRLAFIQEEVYKVLGRYVGFVNIIRDRESLHKYISTSIKIDVISLDTETNRSIDPLTCKIMGLCLYIPNTRPAYVPINHTKPGTEERLDNQITEKDAFEELSRLKDNNTKIIYHNGKFDIRVCYNTLGVRLPIWWDTMIAAQLIDENEVAKLKNQFSINVDPTQKEYNIEKLFTGIPYEWVDPEIFGIYSAIDAYDTYKLQQEQQKIFEQDGMDKMYNLFKNVEVPVVSVVSEMEDNGICMDLEFLEKLNNKYLKKIGLLKQKLSDMLIPYKKELDHYQQLGKIDNPVNYDSPQQLNILLYDILNTPMIEESGRSTDKDTLVALNTPFTETLLEYRHYTKLVSSFTSPLPEWLSKKDGKLHASFNQMGKEENNVRTGRFSSTNPRQNWGLIS